MSSRRQDVQSITATSPASPSTAAATAMFLNLKRLEHFTIDATVQGATGGVLDIYLQKDVNGTWVDWYHFAQIAAAAAAASYTVDSRMSETTAPVTVGTGTTPALAVDTLACKHPGDKVRILFVAGAATSAGAAQTITITGSRFGSHGD